MKYLQYDPIIDKLRHYCIKTKISKTPKSLEATVTLVLIISPD